MLKGLREIKQMCDEAGLTIVSVEPAKGIHKKYLLRAPDGRERHFTMSRNIGDPRASKNRLADLKRFAEGTKHEST